MNGRWNDVKNEYITTGSTMVELGRKYGVSVSAISRRADAEGWKQQRANFRKKAQKKAESVAADIQSQRIRMLMNGGEKAANILCTYLDNVAESRNIKPQDIRAAAEALRSIRDLYRTDDAATDDKLRKVRELLGGVPDALD